MKLKVVLFAAIFVLSIIAGFVMFSQHGARIIGTAPEVDWRALGELDYISGNAPDSLKAYDGKLVRVPGFMVPLEDNQRQVSQFLLVPSPQACIHVPPPPANQMVLVDMEAGSNASVPYGPIWVYGILEIKSVRHMYGESSFHMTGKKIEAYK